MKPWSLARRDLLKHLGLGAACLPLLRAGRARGAAAARHLVIIQMSQGYRQAYWKPAAGALGALPPTLEPFAALEKELIVLPALTNPGAGTGGRGGYGVMFYGLGAAPGGGTYREPAGPTLDQVVGRALPAPGGRTSLNLGVMLERPPQSITTPGGKYCFWTGPGQPIKPLGDPYAVYSQLFTAVPDNPEAKRMLLRRKSILDYAGTELEAYRKRSGLIEREAIEGHLQSLRELEAQLGTLPGSAACAPAAPPAPQVDPNADTSYPVILELHMKLMVAALRCGVTNVVTLQLSDAGAANVNVGAFVPGLPPTGTPYKSATRTWRDVGHNPVLNGADHKKIVDRWFMERVAALLQQLREAQEGGVSLLDDTAVLVGNHMEDGSSGNGQRLPWMLAGRSAFLNGGQCLASDGRPIASVMAGICQALGVTQHPYGEVLSGLIRP